MSDEGVVVEQEVPAEPQVEEQVEIQAEAPEEEKPQEPPIPKGVQKRIDRAVRQKYEAEARAKMLEERLSALEQRTAPQTQQRPIDDSEPTIDKFDNFDQYVAAKAEWIAAKKIEQTFSERENKQRAEYEQATRRQIADNWHRKIAETTAELPDFEDVIASSEAPMTPVMEQAIMESEFGTRIAYYLAQNPQEASKLAQMSPVAQVRAIGRIEAKLESGVPTKVSSAPAPVKTVGGRATVKSDPDKMSVDEWLKWRNDQLKKRA